ncbi:hypothetical protein [Paenibacillus eucommiae]|uniref:Uncharacterized protein n=1 Tax=Paenibacillus eucommiae TaxID=1355755 RepID=A0ABS4IWK7_9BACL|nr:hypothetical protein [Paenibacillus eucommiae]MBP1990914.1 hypothetical protein [Paenibacillus eucommiae]
MYKLLLLILMSLLYMTLYALQTDEEIALHTLFQGKHGLNAAVHAAAQQIDQQKLAEGIHSIDETEAEKAALTYLRSNLRLDGNNDPLPDTFYQSRVEVLYFQVVNENEAFPYTFIHPLYGYMTTLEQPGVIMIIRLEFPRTYSVLQPISWTIKAAAELVI